MAQSPLERKARAHAQKWGLSPDDRMSLAEYYLRRDVRSWNELSEEDFRRLADGFEMAALLLWMKRD